ncbi:MAG: hypothetical protein GY875_25635 [Gammaproteobacteria bacterium]|nr:hypothetical protein [Gammaproteobacteria bacterium]
MKYILIGLLLLPGLGYGGAKAYLHYQVSDHVETAVLVTAPYAVLEYSGISSTLTGELTIDDVRIQINGYRDDIQIGRLGIKTPNFLSLLKLSDLSALSQPGGDSTPEFFGFIAEEIRVAVTDDYYREFYKNTIEAIAPDDIRQRGVQCVGKYGYSPKALQGLGYEELVMSTALILRQEENRFITEIDLDIADMSDIEIDVAVAGNAMMGAAMGTAYRPTLHSLQVKVTDHSLNRRIKNYCTKLGLTPEQIERAHINALQYFGSTMGIEFDEYVIDPYKEYLAGKPTFIATVKPRAPIDMASIAKYKPSDVPALLNLEAVAQ